MSYQLPFAILTTINGTVKHHAIYHFMGMRLTSIERDFLMTTDLWMSYNDHISAAKIIYDSVDIDLRLIPLGKACIACKHL